MLSNTFVQLLVCFQTAFHFTKSHEINGGESFTIGRTSYSSLSNPLKDASSVQSYDLLDALSEDGLISVTGIPGFAELKRDTMTWLHACIMEQGDTNHKIIHEDGTIRRTIASVTVPGPGGAQPFKFASQDNNEDAPASCIQFSNKLGAFRNQVDAVVKAFALRLSSEMDSSLEKPLMETEDGSYSFSDIYSVATEGHHLEHFHSYQKINGEGKSPTSSGLRNDKSEDDTIEMHTDQGFFIAFTPGLMVTHEADNKYEPDLSVPLEESTGFYIERSDGNQIPVPFDARDELVFMMGDGVNQYINPKIVRKSDGTPKKGVRATPHKVVLKSHDANVARVWYGRMALPPPLAYHSAENMTHGDIRSLVNQRGNNSKENQSVHQGIGCSSPDSMRLLSGGNDGGHTSDIDCQDDESIYCWFRCMSLVDQNVSKAQCAEQNLKAQCINPRDQLSDGKKHGDYYPYCSNTTEAVTAYPSLPSYPASETTCNDDEWSKFSVTDEYQHSFNLTTEQTTAMFMWSVLEDKKTVKAKLTFRGLFGYISMGLANLDPEASHKGMNGAPIIMALPYGGGEYTAKYGLDLTKSPTIHEYFIHPQKSSFRHWSTPTSSSVIATKSILPENIDYSATLSTECFTSLTFETDRINDQLFNTSGSDEVMWAANGNDYFAGHHGKNRARFSVDWLSGNAAFYVAPKEKEATPKPTLPPTSKKSFSQALEIQTWMAITIVVILHSSFL